MAPNTTHSISIGAFRDEQAEKRTLKANERLDAVLRLLAFAMRRRLAQYRALDPQNSLAVFLAHVPAEEVFRHRRPIRRALKDPALADDMFISRATLRVYRSRLYRFLAMLEQHFGRHKAPSNPVLEPAWQQEVEALKEIEPATPSLTAFKRLATFASEQNWTPDSIDGERIESFRIWLETEGKLQTHARYFRHAGQAWSILAEARRVPAHSFLPRRKTGYHYGLRREDLPDQLREMLSHYEVCARSDDADERTGVSALADSSLALHVDILLDYWGFLQQEEGVALAECTAVDLLSQEHLKAFHRFAITRAGGKAMQWHMRRMFFLRTFARRYVSVHCGPVDTEWMVALFHKTTSHERNEQAPIYKRALVDQTLAHIDAQLAEAEEEGWAMRRRLALSTARFAIAFLADHPLRGINLREAHLGQEFDLEKRTFRVRTKNGAVLHETLSASAWQHLQDYLAIRREAQIYSTAVLVSADGNRLSYASFHRQITHHFALATDTHFTPHAFRYLAVGEALEHTGDPVYAGAAIGDRSSRVVEKSYNRYAPAQAAEMWHLLVKAFRNNTREALPPPIQVLLERAEHEPKLKADLMAVVHEIESEEKSHVA
jgi:hypothetical protein